MSKSRKLLLEQLEDRLTPVTWGLAWPDPGHLTLSFVPDGTQVGAYQSDLFQTLNAVAPTSVWEEEILRALQTWAVNANINIGLVADQGQPLGTSGFMQGDPRFGDIRVAMAPLDGSNHVADTMPYDPSIGTWSGDMIFNSLDSFGVDGSGGQYDLYSVALHEAGHVFGFPDELTDPTSALYAIYAGVRTGLPSEDIALLQGLYGGPRAADTEGNNSLATATFLANPAQAAVSDDISSLTDSHYYSFTAGAAGAGTTTTSFTVQVQTEGISLLEPSVTVFDVNGDVVGSAAATDPINNNVSVRIASAQPGATYYVEVTGATSSVFGIGSYQMSVQFANAAGQTAASAGPVVSAPGVPTGMTNSSFATALALNQLQASTSTQGFTYNAGGDIETSTQIDYYQVTAPALSAAGTELLTVSAASIDANGLNPYIQVLDGSQNLLATTVTDNGNGTFTVQLPGIVSGNTYYIEVSALPGASQNVGGYALTVQFNNAAATSFNQLAASTVSGSTSTGPQTITIGTAGVFQFALAASAQGTSVSAQVQVTIYDQNGNQVFNMAAASGQPLTTGFTYLAAGTYTAVFTVTAAGGSEQNLSCTLGGLRISDPQVAVPIDPTQSPTGTTTTGSSGGSSGTPVSTGTPPVANPVSSPVTSSSSTDDSTSDDSSDSTTGTTTASTTTGSTSTATTAPSSTTDSSDSSASPASSSSTAATPSTTDASSATTAASSGSATAAPSTTTTTSSTATTPASTAPASTSTSTTGSSTTTCGC